MYLRTWCFGLALLFAACGDNDGPPPCGSDCASQRAYDAVAYRLTARFDWTAERLIASEEVTLTTAPETRLIQLDSAVAVARVYAGSQALGFTADGAGRTLTVDLSPLVRDGAEVTFTIDYQAPLNDSLVAPPQDVEDPVTSRVVYTNSEPDRGSGWLVAKHDPSDRALFTVELTVPAGDDAIANGERVADEVRDQARVIRYQLDQPIPTYLMAFATGQLEHTDRTDGRVPLSLWYRRGLEIDPSRNLDVVVEDLAHFEGLIGPYPWARYAVVLLPDFPGGMENATITFNNERSGLGQVRRRLNAHELAHQWFGDWVTMETYDDVWIKEGLATLLAAEAQRGWRDDEARGRLFGSDFGFAPDDAIVDRSLTGLDKYTSGPYDRAAWLLTQIRSQVGDAAFWATLRGVLASRALGHIGSEAFVRSFAPALDEATIVRILDSLEQYDVPTVAVASVPVATGTEVTFTLSDPTAALFAPIEITVVDAAGTVATRPLVAQEPLTVLVPTGGYLAPDERDRHPELGLVAATEAAEALTPLLVPTSPAALDVFLSRSAAHQERATSAGDQVAPPPDLVRLCALLDSLWARDAVAPQGCPPVVDPADPAR